MGKSSDKPVKLTPSKGSLDEMAGRVAKKAKAIRSGEEPAPVSSTTAPDALDDSTEPPKDTAADNARAAKRAAGYTKLKFMDATAEQDSYDRFEAWANLEDKLEAIAVLLKDGEELAPSLWDQIITELVTLACEDACLSLAQVRNASNKGLQAMAEMKAARRRQQRPYSTNLLKSPKIHDLLSGLARR